MKLSKVAQSMIKVIGVLTLIIIAAGAVVCYIRSIPALPFALGTVLGSALTALKVAMLDRTVEKAVSMDAKAAAGYVTLQQLLRFLLTGALLVLGALTSFISLWGVAAGILTLQLSAYCMKFFFKDEEGLPDEKTQDNAAQDNIDQDGETKDINVQDEQS